MTISIEEMEKEMDEFISMMMMTKGNGNLLTNEIEEEGENETKEEYEARTKRNRTICMLRAFESSQDKIKKAGGNAGLALNIDIAKEHEENHKMEID